MLFLHLVHEKEFLLIFVGFFLKAEWDHICLSAA